MNTTVLIFLCLMLACPVAAFASNFFLHDRPNLAADLAGYSIGFGFLVGLGLLSYLSFSYTSALYLFMNLSPLNLLLCSLVLLVSFIVHRFSSRYMDGDRHKNRFFLLLAAITCSAQLMMLADNILFFWGAWTVSNAVLVLLMVHKKEWAAAKHSGLLAFYTLSIGSLCLLTAFIILRVCCSTNSISALNNWPNLGYFTLASLSMGLILVGAIVQSGLFPCHRWLISSLNSPTPVSALMHAGLVNGGGILIVKFAPLMLHYPGLLTLLFLVGSLSAVLGTVWKLMQHDIKKMLACSTMAQMGFMMMQCGLGLFAAAIAHLCWHGLFKAYLFLSSGSAVKQRKARFQSSKVSPMMIIESIVGGSVAMVAFAVLTHKSLSVHEASSFVLLFAFIAGAQLMLTWIRDHQGMLNTLSGLFLALISGLIYGGSIQLIQWLIPNISILIAPQLSIIHWFVMALFGVLWAAFSFGWLQQWSNSTWGCWLYMNLYNSSQPSNKTITAFRHDYHY